MKYLLNKSVHSMNKKISVSSTFRILQQTRNCLIILTIATFFCSCKEKDTHEDLHEDASVLFSAYNSDYELFIEATPFSAAVISEV
jgi:hypothetical protein